MWPKLLELLPHLTRLVPLMEKYFSTRQATDKASENALQAMAEGVRGDLGQVTAAHAGLYRQLQDLSAQVAVLETELGRTRAAAERAESAARTPNPELVAAITTIKRVVFAIFLVVVLLFTVVVARWK